MEKLKVIAVGTFRASQYYNYITEGSKEDIAYTYLSFAQGITHFFHSEDMHAQVVIMDPMETKGTIWLPLYRVAVNDIILWNSKYVNVYKTLVDTEEFKAKLSGKIPCKNDRMRALVKQEEVADSLRKAMIAGTPDALRKAMIAATINPEITEDIQKFQNMWYVQVDRAPSVNIEEQSMIESKDQEIKDFLSFINQHDYTLAQVQCLIETEIGKTTKFTCPKCKTKNNKRFCCVCGQGTF